MTKTLVHPNSSTSRIPMPQIRSKETERADTTSSKRSRFEDIQPEFQKKTMKEKENKIVKLYEKDQHRALKRVNTRGKVREFFKDARGHDLNDPLLHRRFEKNNNQESTGIPTYQFNNNNSRNNNEYQLDPKVSTNHYGNGSLPTSSRSTPHFKNSRGRDKSSPLEPIPRGNKSDEFTNGFTHIPPINNSDDSDASSSANKQTTVRKTQSFTLKKGADHSLNSSYDKDSLSGSMRLSTGKMSDFQKWKLQTQTAGYSAGSSGSLSDRGDDVTDDGYETVPDLTKVLKDKERALQAQIHSEKVEMERLKKETEVRKRKEEMDRKKAAAEEKKKQQEELARKKKEQEQARTQQRADEKKRKDAEAQMKKDKERERKEKEQKEKEQKDKQRKQPVTKKPSQSKMKRKDSTTSFADNEPYVPPDAQLDFYANAANDDDAYGAKVKMATCSICSRSFAADRLEKHTKICKKSEIADKKRKVFDMSKMRTDGTEHAQYNGKSNSKKAPPKNEPPKKDWRKQHNEFIESIRYAKKVGEMEKKGVSAANLPPPPKSDYSDYVQCQYCTKKFAASVAERHIPKCKNIRSNKPAGKR